METDTQGAKAVGRGAEDGRGGRDSARLHCRLGGGGPTSLAVAMQAGFCRDMNLVSSHVPEGRCLAPWAEWYHLQGYGSEQ